jgi:hypothetical protein
MKYYTQDQHLQWLLDYLEYHKHKHKYGSKDFRNIHMMQSGAVMGRFTHIAQWGIRQHVPHIEEIKNFKPPTPPEDWILTESFEDALDVTQAYEAIQYPE